MTSSKITTKDIYYFDQDEYSHEFYCCADNHTLIAFTTQYCPLCDEKEQHGIVKDEYLELVDEYEDIVENYLELKVQAKKLAPELLL